MSDTPRRRRPGIRYEMLVGWEDDEKFDGLKWPTVQMWLRLLGYIRLNGTDGDVPLARAKKLGSSPASAWRMLGILAKRSLVNLSGDVVSVPAYLTHNRPHAAIVAQAERRSQRAKKHRSRSQRTGQYGDVVSLSPTEREGDGDAARAQEGAASPGETRRWRGRRVRRDAAGKVEVEIHPGTWTPLIRFDPTASSATVWHDATLAPCKNQ